MEVEESRIRVLLVDDHPVTLRGLSQCLHGTGKIEIVGTAADGIEAIQQAKKLQPDVVLLDLTLPRMPGLQVLSVLRSEVPKSKVLVFTIHNNKEFLQECLRLGASGYIVKSSPPEVLVEAVEGVLFGNLAVDKQILKSLRSKGIPEAIQIPVPVQEGSYLTQKENRILQLIVKGCTPHEIAETLNLGYYTVTTHFKHIYRKLDVHSRSAAIAKALQEHLVEL